MTVAEIKEYIDKQIADIEKDKYIYNDIGETVGEIKGFRKIEHALYEINSMLDELEQPIEIDTEKYFETMDKIISEEIKGSKS